MAGKNSRSLLMVYFFVLSMLISDIEEPLESDDCAFYLSNYTQWLFMQPVTSWETRAKTAIQDAWSILHSGYYMDVSKRVRSLFGTLSRCLAGTHSDTVGAKFLLDRSRIVDNSFTSSNSAMSLSEGWSLGLGESRDGTPLASESVFPDLSGSCSYHCNKLATTFTTRSNPFVMRGAVLDWSALTKWKYRDFWCHAFRGSFVPIEIGGYLSADFEQALVTIEEFIDALMSEASHSDGHMVYFAQYDMFARFPTLVYDAEPLPMSYAFPDASYTRYIFFGPCGTVSPLHTDPCDNVFCQVVGYKYIRLHPPSAKDSLYIHTDDPWSNSTMLQGDVTQRGADNEYPLYKMAEIYEAYLLPGDCIFIPKGWWHFVKSLSPSISLASFIEDHDKS